MEFKDYYKVMMVAENASAQGIKKSFRKLARRYHPDVSKEEDAEKKFKEINEAYEVLKDKEKRKEYDQLKAMGAMNQEGGFSPPPGWESATQFSDKGFDAGEFSDFFSSVFGQEGGFHRGANQDGSNQFRMRGEDIHAEISLFLEDVVEASERVFEYTLPTVDQRGLVSHQNKKLKIKIPAGTADGQHLRIKGQGSPGLGGEAAGDLIIKVRIAPHPMYSLSGKDISLIVPISPWEAALGAKILVPTLQGKLNVSIPPQSQAGSKLRLAGKGLTGKPPGDFYVILKVVMPKNETPQSKELFAQLAEELPFNPRSEWELKS